MNWYLAALKNYAGFSGRAQRKEYWMFALFYFITCAALCIVEWIVGGPGILGSLYSLAVFIPGIAVTIRRLHDTNKSGWLLLVGFIPFIGWIVLLVFMVQDSQAGDNQYGPNPKAGMEQAA